MAGKKDSKSKSRAKAKEIVAADQPDESHKEEKKAEGWSEWLRTNEGVGWMQFFVITNALVLIVTAGLPKIWQTIDIIKSSL